MILQSLPTYQYFHEQEAEAEKAALGEKAKKEQEEKDSSGVGEDRCKVELELKVMGTKMDVDNEDLEDDGDGYSECESDVNSYGWRGENSHSESASDSDEEKDELEKAKVEQCLKQAHKCPRIRVYPQASTASLLPNLRRRQSNRRSCESSSRVSTRIFSKRRKRSHIKRGRRTVTTKTRKNTKSRRKIGIDGLFNKLSDNHIFKIWPYKYIRPFESNLYGFLVFKVSSMKSLANQHLIVTGSHSDSTTSLGIVVLISSLPLPTSLLPPLPPSPFWHSLRRSTGEGEKTAVSAPLVPI